MMRLWQSYVVVCVALLVLVFGTAYACGVDPTYEHGCPDEHTVTFETGGDYTRVVCERTSPTYADEITVALSDLTCYVEYITLPGGGSP